MFREALEQLEKDFADISEQNTERQRLLFEIYHKVEEAENGDEGDKRIALLEIKKLLKESGNYLPF